MIPYFFVILFYSIITGFKTESVADPGFPIGGRGPRRGGVDSRGGYVSKILYVKTKESGSVGGVCAGHAPLDPPMGVHNMDYVLTGPAAAHRTPCKTFPTFYPLFYALCYASFTVYTEIKRQAEIVNYIFFY